MPTFHIDPEDEILHYISYTRSKYNMYETIEKCIPTRDVKRMIFPRDCTSFELFDRVFRHSDTDDTIFVGEVINRSQYYIGTIYDLDAVAKELGKTSPEYELLADINPEKIVKVYGDEFLSVRDNDHVVLPSRVKFGSEFGIAPNAPTPTHTLTMEK